MASKVFPKRLLKSCHKSGGEAELAGLGDIVSELGNSVLPMLDFDFGEVDLEIVVMVLSTGAGNKVRCAQLPK